VPDQLEKAQLHNVAVEVLTRVTADVIVAAAAMITLASQRNHSLRGTITSPRCCDETFASIQFSYVFTSELKHDITLLDFGGRRCSHLPLSYANGAVYSKHVNGQITYRYIDLL